MVALRRLHRTEAASCRVLLPAELSFIARVRECARLLKNVLRTQHARAAWGLLARDGHSAPVFVGGESLRCEHQPEALAPRRAHLRRVFLLLSPEVSVSQHFAANFGSSSASSHAVSSAR